ncbi:hypothetical protein LZ318_00255, partial [Saccharopolyspora indica]
MSKILIAEDETRIAAFIEKGLRANGPTTTAVGDGDTAQAYPLTGDFAPAGLDLGLPGKDGFSALRAVRAQHMTDNVGGGNEHTNRAITEQVLRL